ncbi:reverse transcriptase domain-containing protein [Tanacetum coccineum]
MVIKSKTEPEMIKDVEETLLTLKKLLPKESGQIQKKQRPCSRKGSTLPRHPQKVYKQKGLSLDNRGRRSIPGNEETDNGATNLNGPKEGRTYGLPAANEAVIFVLLVERQRRQAPIHYVSRTQQGAEINYLPMEKLVLALVYAARRLRRYFQGHTIKVITDKPISKILNNREATGRLAKWGIELEAYGIKYAPRSAIKGQVLADFLADTMAEDNSTQVKASRLNDTLREGKSREEQEAPETKTPENWGTETDIWKLYTDGATNEHGSEAGLILKDPEGAEYSYAL